MARVLIGNFKGPKGDKGDTGEGKTGPAGAAGQRGSRWSEGTAITGTSTTATVFSGTGIADALANDMYMNTSTGNVYRCTVGGAAAVAKWVFAGNLKGTKGDKGNTGAKGATGLKALQPNRRWTSTFTTVGATASAPFTDFNRNPVVGDVFMNVDGSSNIGQWKITAISGTTATFQLISYVSAKGAKGDTGASGTADTTFTEAATLTKLASGESFKAMLGKIAKAVSTIFDKFDKKNIVNNQTTTVAGFALDARQANPNIDGSLAKQISDLNGSLENLNNFTDIPSNSDLNDIKFFNVGKYCCSLNIVAETVLNSPFTTAFTMEVFYSAGTPNYIAQKAIEFASGHCEWRMRDLGSGTIVQDWIQLY
nr:MAG TPA: Baseplate component [Caudoviricetes sp.]